MSQPFFVRPLTRAERTAIRAVRKRPPSHAVYLRAQAVHFSSQKLTAEAIAAILERHRTTVFRWLQAFDAHGVHVRLCDSQSVVADGPLAWAAGVVGFGAAVLAEVGGADLQDGFATAVVPEFFRALDPIIELFDQRFDRRAAGRQAFAAVRDCKQITVAF